MKRFALIAGLVALAAVAVVIVAHVWPGSWLGMRVGFLRWFA